MHAYLIIGTDKKSVDEEIAKLCHKLSLNPLEFPLGKIDEVRKLNSFTALSVNKKTAIILKNIEGSTLEALNAFLKNLEEPQENLFYILTAGSIHKVLPTIISRCQIIKVGDSQNIKDKELFEIFVRLKTAEKFSYFEKIRKREEAINFMRDLIFFMHQKLINDSQNHLSLSKIIKEGQITLTNLEANGNVSLQLTNFAVNTDNIDTSTH